MRTGYIWLVVMIAALICYFMSGCATYETWALDPATGQLVMVGKGNTTGILRNYVTKRTYDKDTGRLIEETAASTSTTAEIMGAFNELIGTLSDVWNKNKP